MGVSKKGLSLLTFFLIHCLLFGIATINFLYAEKLERNEDEITVISENMLFRPIVQEKIYSPLISQSVLELTPEEAIYVCGTQIDYDYFDDSTAQNSNSYGFLAKYEFNSSLRWNATWELPPWGKTWDLKMDQDRNLYTLETNSPLKTGNGSFTHIQYYDGNHHTIRIQKWTPTGEKISIFSWPIPILPVLMYMDVDNAGNIFVVLNSDENGSILFKFSNLGQFQWQKIYENDWLRSPIFDQLDNVYIQLSKTLLKYASNGTLLLNYSFNSSLVGIQTNLQEEVFACTVNYSLRPVVDLIAIYKFDNKSKLIFNHTVHLEGFQIGYLSNIDRNSSNGYNLLIKRRGNSHTETFGSLLLSWDDGGMEFRTRLIESEKIYSQVFFDDIGCMYEISADIIQVSLLKWDSNLSLIGEQSLEFIPEYRTTYPIFTTIWFYIALTNAVCLILVWITLKKSAPTEISLEKMKKNPLSEHPQLPLESISPRLSQNPYKLHKSVIYSLGFSCLCLIFGLIMISEFSSYLVQIIYLSASLLGVYLVWLLYQTYRSRQKTFFLRPTDFYAKSAQVLWFGGFLYFGISLARFLYLTPEYSFLQNLHWTDLLGFILICISAFSEELIFRWCLLTPCLQQKVSKKTMIIMTFLQALIWAAFHRQYWDNPVQLVMVFVLGIYFGVLYLFSQDIRKPIIIHCLINLVGILDFYCRTL